MKADNSDHVQIHRRRQHAAVLVIGMVAADFGASGSRENADLFPLGIQLRKFVQCRRVPLLLVHQHVCIVTIQLFQLLVQLSRFQCLFPFCNCHHRSHILSFYFSRTVRNFLKLL